MTIHRNIKVDVEEDINEIVFRRWLTHQILNVFLNHYLIDISIQRNFYFLFEFISDC